MEKYGIQGDGTKGEERDLGCDGICLQVERPVNADKSRDLAHSALNGLLCTAWKTC